MALTGLPKKQTPTALHQLMFVIQQMSNELLLAETGVGLSSVLIMSGLSQAVPSSQRAVAAKLRQTEANISRQLHVMKRQGLVTVRQNRKDKRQRDVLLTAKGARQYAKASSLLDKQQKDLLRLIATAEARAFGQTVDSLLKGLLIS